MMNQYVIGVPDLSVRCPAKAAHPVVPTPPEARGAFGSLRSFDLIESRAGFASSLIGKLPGVAHAGEVDHQRVWIPANVGVILCVKYKMLLLIEDSGSKAGQCLQNTEGKVGVAHEIAGEDDTLDGNPRHQRQPQNAAQNHAGFLFPKQ